MKKHGTCPVCEGIPASKIPDHANVNHQTSLAARDTCGDDVCIVMYCLGDALRKTVGCIAREEEQREKAFNYAISCLTVDP
jgi:hypothetical protein